MPAITWDYLDKGSSPIDWCEENYVVSPYIAEFVNTFSNIFFFIFPPLLINLHTNYAKYQGQGIHVIWVLLIVVGVCSAYFHATLSLLGQLLDEIAILWVIMAGFAMWFPKQAFPSSWRSSSDGRVKFSYFCFCFTVLATIMGFMQPIVNAFILLLLGVPTMLLLAYELRLEYCDAVVSLGHRTIVLWVLAVLCWVTDRIFCSWCATIGFPYLHAAWHLLIFLASYPACVLFAYFQAKKNSSGPVPILRFYPWNSFQLGVPFVEIDHQHRLDYREVNGNDVTWQKIK